MDNRGQPLIASAGWSKGKPNELTLRYTIFPSHPGMQTQLPTQIRYYDVIATAWEVPFEFGDLPLP